MVLEKVHARNFVDVEVRLDGKHYMHCLFTRCTFLYDGGEFVIEDTMALTECGLKLGGTAEKTLELLRGFGFIKPGSVKLVLPD
jgi:hypothetical protein